MLKQKYLWLPLWVEGLYVCSADFKSVNVCSMEVPIFESFES
jgi:hypothetical protein